MTKANLTLIIPGQEPIHMTDPQLSRMAARAGRKDRTMKNNTGIDGKTDTPSSSFAKDQLASVVERIETLETQKKDLSDDIRDVYSEAKGNGFEVKALRRIVRLRRMDGSQKAAHDEVESIVEVYMQSLGML